ncbi:MAG: DUF3489 domain-containing protein [Alphaproteobacteria bacterium]|nr:DUF3489 domain-containing protein [Alphaproteobacteria bacterium]MBU2377864.1 DUF3489 domain-containing protein [Alphaproteobacteria bacterium]
MIQTPDTAQTPGTAQAPADAKIARKTRKAKAAPPKIVPKPAADRKPRASRAKGFVPELATETNAKSPAGKLGVVAAMLHRPEGATVAQMSEATGWQAHSVRGAIAGSLKKKHGLTIVTEAAEGGRVYRIAGAAA